MGSGKLGQRLIGETLLTRKSTIESALGKTIISLFHVRGNIQMAQKIY